MVARVPRRGVKKELLAGGENEEVAPLRTPALISAVDVTTCVNTAFTTKNARFETASYVQQIAEDMTRQRARDHPESFTSEIEILIPKKRKTLFYHPTLAKEFVTRLENTYPGITFQSADDVFVANDHEPAAIARRAATYIIYQKMDAYTRVPVLDRSDIGGNERSSAIEPTPEFITAV